MRKIYVGVTVGVLVLGLFGVVSYKLGYTYLGLKDPTQQVNVTYRVCGSDLIAAYGKIDTGSPDSDAKLLNSLAGRIKNLAHSQEDPTCQTMLFFIAFRTENYDAMRQPMQLVKSMYDKGIFADSNLPTGYTVNKMNSLLKEVVSDTKSN